MTYVKTYLPTLKTHVVNLKREAKDLSRDLQRLEFRGKLGSKTLYYLYAVAGRPRETRAVSSRREGWEGEVLFPNPPRPRAPLLRFPR